MPMYNLVEYNHKYLRASRSLWQYCKDEPDYDNITDSESFKLKLRLTNNNGNEVSVSAEVTVPLKHLSNFGGELLKCF